MAYHTLSHKWLFSFVLLSFAFHVVVAGALAHEDHGHGHGEMHSSMNMDTMHNAATQNNTKLVFSNTTTEDSYWTLEGGRFLLYSHIIIMTIGWTIILPICKSPLFCFNFVHQLPFFFVWLDYSLFPQHGI